MAVKKIINPDKEKDVMLAKDSTKKTKKTKAGTSDAEKVTKQSMAEKPAEKKDVPVIDHFNVIRFVLMTEKSIQNIEKENKLVFIVNREATKKQISDAVQSAFSAAASNVKTSIDQKGRKKAFVRFAKAGEAGDIAVRLGII